MLPFLLYARLSVLMVIAIAYAAFDVFNKRNVPDIFAYAALAVAFLLTFTYGTRTMEISLLIAAIIIALGYVVYKRGVMGAGDFLEFATISLILPIQPAAMLSAVPQMGFPFIFSVLISTGYTAVISMMAYYLAKASIKGKIHLSRIRKGSLRAGALLLLAYLAMLVVISYFAGFRLIPSFLILSIGIASSITVVFEKELNAQMISYAYPSELHPEDMIATNLMSPAEKAYFMKKSKHFGRLVTKPLLKDIRDARRKVPLYTSGVPLALFALLGIIISLAFGNILLYILL